MRKFNYNTFTTMINYFERMRARPKINQLVCKELLFVHYQCPLEPIIKYDSWSLHNYITYVISGKKAFKSPTGSWVIEQDQAAFIRKGAAIIERPILEELCIVTFFIPDSYLRTFATEHPALLQNRAQGNTEVDLVTMLPVDSRMKAYIDSLIPYFFTLNRSSEELLELKFRALLLNIFDNPENVQLISYLQQLSSSQECQLRNVMEANYLHDLTLEDYAQLTNLSLSTFKRHFNDVYKTSPRQWLLSRKLDHAHKLLLTTDLSVTDITFNCGFQDSGYFSQAFRRKYGDAPLRFRHQSRAIHS